jgi:hypothetical protein
MNGPRAVPPEYETVTRRINRSLSSLAQVVESVAATVRPLRVELPFATAPGTPPVLRTTGRLYGRGPRVARYTRVDVELSAWSHGATELRIRPVTRRVPAWSRRRQRRYFDVAHRTVDELARTLDRTALRNEIATGIYRRMHLATTPVHRAQQLNR